MTIDAYSNAFPRVPTGWDYQRGLVRLCLATPCEAVIRDTSAQGPLECLYCDECRPGPWCGCAICYAEFPMLPVPEEHPF